MLMAGIKAFASDESGATAIEYGLIAGLVAVAIIGSFTVLGNGLIELFNTQTANIIADQTAIIP
jgi:pilus assembly protein Flp/PilA